MEKALTVGRLAEIAGLSRKAIRYYESEKLIPRAARSPVGYRIYNPKVIDRLKFIQKAKAIGFSLDEIRGILNLTDLGRPCCDQVYEWSAKRLRELDEQIKFLSRLRRQIFRYRQEWEAEKRTAQSAKVPESEICRLINKVELPEVKKP